MASADPSYAYETTDTAWQILTDFILPNVVGRDFESPEDILAPVWWVRGHGMAKAAVEMPRRNARLVAAALRPKPVASPARARARAARASPRKERKETEKANHRKIKTETIGIQTKVQARAKQKAQAKTGGETVLATGEPIT